MRSVLGSLVLVSVLAVPASLLADPLANNNWYEFSFTAVGVPALGCYPADQSPQALNCLPSFPDPSIFAPTPPWVIDVVDGSGTLTVTDAFLYGDAFDVYNYGVFLFATPPVPYTGNGCGDDPVDCLADPNSSHASMVLGQGLYSITIVPYAIGDAGAAYFYVTDTPEPSELPVLLLVSGFALRLAARRRSLRN